MVLTLSSKLGYATVISGQERRKSSEVALLSRGRLLGSQLLDAVLFQAS